ncbi:hypothetical protein chiPu_0028431 [Chiloscyllium punctatum]|uniref:Uncharacterized protein n=1 Tax=Chiloscyllium punctatum TaxID=137246 RepID=A0A401TP21_CHIPU|nr:hypothetical protein [Chiloscyllium punctatum]
MLTARRAGLTNGDYVFFHVDVFGESLQGGRGQGALLPWKRQDPEDQDAKEAYRILDPTALDSFRSQISPIPEPSAPDSL